MRLTKQMKENLYVIISNKTVNPLETVEHKLIKQIQDVIYEQEPLFKQYVDKYGINYSMRETFYVYGIKNSNYSTSIDLFVPTVSIARKIILGSTESNSIHSPEKVQEAVLEPITKLAEAFDKQFEYFDTLSNLRTTIDSCTTDKQLANMYPEFVKYFNKAEITVKSQKQLPAKLGLPENLTKYGLVLETEEERETKKDLEETIKQDIEEDNK